jgi:hypothetical protein
LGGRRLEVCGGSGGTTASMPIEQLLAKPNLNWLSANVIASLGTAHMPGQIFISYRRNDASAEARLIYDRLTKFFGQNTVFMDVESIRPNQNFRQILEK